MKLGGIRMPGTARVSGKVARKIDVQPIPGDDSGGTQTDLGYEGAKVTVTVRMWTQAHLDAFSTFADRFRPKKDESKPNPVDVIHPALGVLGIRSLTIESIGLPEPGQTSGVYEASIELLEFIPEIKKGKGDAITLSASDTDIGGFTIAGADKIKPGQDGSTTNPDNKAANPPIGPALPTPAAPPLPSSTAPLVPGLNLPGLNLPGGN